MIHKILIWGLCFVCIVSPLCGQPVTNYNALSPEALQELRQSYEELADCFDKEGDTQRAKEMRRRAKAIPIPPKDSLQTILLEECKQAPIQAQDSYTEYIRPLQNKNPIKKAYLQQMLQNLKQPDSAHAEESAYYVLNRYLLGLLTGNLDVVVGCFDTEMLYPGYTDVLNKQDILGIYAEIIATCQMDNLSLEDFYRFDKPPTLHIIDDTHIEYILYAQKQSPITFYNSKFWADFFGQTQHVYTLIKKNDCWYLSALHIFLEAKE